MPHNRLNTLAADSYRRNQHDIWEEHQLSQPEDADFNAPDARLEFFEVDNNSD